MSHKLSRAPFGASLVVLSSLFYASYGIWTKLMGEFFGGYTASALRSILVLVILVPLAFLGKAIEKPAFGKNWRYLVGMIAASTLVWGPLYYAILHAGVGITLSINYVAIVIGMFFFGWLFAKEKFTKDKAISAGVGIAGLWLVFSPSVDGVGWLALCAGIVSGLGVAANTVMAKQLTYRATYSTIMLWATSVVANIPMAFILSEARPEVGLHVEWLYLVIFAVASVLASWLLMRGLKLIEAGAAGVLGLLEIVFGLVFGVVFFGEHLAFVTVLGIVIILIAVAIPYFKDYAAAKTDMKHKQD